MGNVQHNGKLKIPVYCFSLAETCFFLSVYDE